MTRSKELLNILEGQFSDRELKFIEVSNPSSKFPVSRYIYRSFNVSEHDSEWWFTRPKPSGELGKSKRFKNKQGVMKAVDRYIKQAFSKKETEEWYRK